MNDFHVRWSILHLAYYSQCYNLLPSPVSRNVISFLAISIVLDAEISQARTNILRSSLSSTEVRLHYFMLLILCSTAKSVCRANLFRADQCRRRELFGSGREPHSHSANPGSIAVSVGNIIRNASQIGLPRTSDLRGYPTSTIRGNMNA